SGSRRGRCGFRARPPMAGQLARSSVQRPEISMSDGQMAPPSPSDVCRSGHVLVITPYPPFPGGTSVLMRNLLGCFDGSSFTVVTDHGHADAHVEGGCAPNVVRAISSITTSSRVNQVWLDAQLPLAVTRIL